MKKILSILLCLIFIGWLVVQVSSYLRPTPYTKELDLIVKEGPKKLDHGISENIRELLILEMSKHDTMKLELWKEVIHTGLPVIGTIVCTYLTLKFKFKKA